VSDAAATRSRSERFAHLISELFSPVYQVFFMLLVVGIHSAGLAQGLLLGAVASLFAGGIPYLILATGVRRGRFTDMHLSRREERPIMMAIGLASVAVGLGLMALLDAPRELFALVGAMVAGVAVALLISSFWKISIHTSVTAGSATILAIVFGPWALLLGSVVAAVAWARVRLGAHTVSQVLVGAAVGAGVAYGAFTALS
jgi:membrane-associated phospholipid phosphatase